MLEKWQKLILHPDPDDDQCQNLIDMSLGYTQFTQKISRKSVQNFLSNLVHVFTDRQTGRQTNKVKHYLLLWRR